MADWVEDLKKWTRWSERWNADHAEFGGDLGASLGPLIRRSRWILEEDDGTENGPGTPKHFARKILDRWELARKCIERGDGQNAARFALDISRFYEKAIAAQRGRKAGSASKVRKWAVELASYLRSKGHDKQSEIALLEEGLELDTTEFEYRFRIEGDAIFCTDALARTDKADIGRLAISTFFDKGRYFTADG